MMNYEIFKEVVKEKFMDYMPEKFKGMELVAEPVEKVNVTLDGIILREEGRNISPTIYINDMYKKYQDCGDLEETLMAACDFMERAYEQTPVVDVDSIMRDANEKIVFQLINTEQNKTFLEQVPHRELLGKGTIDKKSSGETKGRQGSSSRNYDVLGRELFTPDEVRKLDNKKCIIFIRGFDPIMDNKFIPFNHPMFNQTADGKGEPYVHQIRGADNLIGPPFEILSDKAVKYYEKLKDKGENVYIDSLTYEQFMMLGDAELSRRFSMQDEAEQKAKIDREQANELEYVDESQKSDASESANASSGSAGAKPVRNPEREKPKWEDTITNRMLHWSYTPEQKEEVKKALAAGVPKATILTYFYPEVTVEKMSSYRKKQ